MSDSSYDDMKDMLSKYELCALSDLSAELICGICSKIIMEPYSISCGCNFCKNCLYNYMKDGRRLCPKHQGSSNSYTNSYFNQTIKERVENITVKCPNTSCNAQSTLRDIKQHFILCYSLNKMCNGPEINVKDKRSDYGKDESVEVMKIIDNLKTEMENMRKKYEEQYCRQEQEIYSLKEDVKEIQEQLKMCKHLYEKSCEEHRTELEALNQSSVNLKNVVEVISSDVTEVKHRVYDMKINEDDRYDTIHMELAEVRKDVSVSDKKNNMLKRQVKLFERSIDDLTVRIGRHDYGEYVWMVSNFSEKKRDAESGKRLVYKSEPFYSHRNGYKMCIRIYPNGFGAGLGTYLYLGFVLMRGEYDDVLHWPFKHRVTLSIVNQNTGEDHTKMEYEYNTTSITLRYILERSTEEKNVGLGYSRFILLDYLARNADIFNDDKIYLRCSVRPALSQTEEVINYLNM